MAGRIVMICANPATRLALTLPNLGLDRAAVHRSSSFRAKTDARPARRTGAAVRAKRPANLEGQRLSARRFSVSRPAQASPTDIATVAAHITDMPAPLTLDSAAELAATLAHTSALLEIDDAGYPAFATLTPHLTDKDRHRHWASMLDAANRQLALDDPRTGAAAALELLDDALAAGDSAECLLDLDAELHRAIDPADRPGETDYDGYHIHSLALDLASRWDTELVRRARSAVDHDQPSGVNSRPAH